MTKVQGLHSSYARAAVHKLLSKHGWLMGMCMSTLTALLPRACAPQYELLKKCGKLMGMYVNRVNGGWAEARKWGPPEVASCSDVSSWAKGDQYTIYRADVM